MPLKLFLSLIGTPRGRIKPCAAAYLLFQVLAHFLGKHYVKCTPSD
jgi:hypothetical protein